jgi:TM2 domain-containing membrane protein YozV
VKGQVLDYSVQSSTGVISTNEGGRYAFSGSEWKTDGHPTRGIWVDFDVKGETATSIYKALASGASPVSAKSKPAVTLWAIFLGGFGAHKFYMGSWGWGIVYLVFCWLYIPFIIALVEWIRYVLMSDDEFHSKVSQFKSGPFAFFW